MSVVGEGLYTGRAKGGGCVSLTGIPAHLPILNGYFERSFSGTIPGDGRMEEDADALFQYGNRLLKNEF
jgi:hypothetical protein